MRKMPWLGKVLNSYSLVYFPERFKMNHLLIENYIPTAQVRLGNSYTLSWITTAHFHTCFSLFFPLFSPYSHNNNTCKKSCNAVVWSTIQDSLSIPDWGVPLQLWVEFNQNLWVCSCKVGTQNKETVFYSWYGWIPVSANMPLHAAMYTFFFK